MNPGYGVMLDRSSSAPASFFLHLYNCPDSGHGGLHAILRYRSKRVITATLAHYMAKSTLFLYTYKLPWWDLALGCFAIVGWLLVLPSLPSLERMLPWSTFIIEWKELQWTLLSSASCSHSASSAWWAVRYVSNCSGQETSRTASPCSSFSYVTFTFPTLFNKGSTCEFLLSFLLLGIKVQRHQTRSDPEIKSLNPIHSNPDWLPTLHWHLTKSLYVTKTFISFDF